MRAVKTSAKNPKQLWAVFPTQRPPITVFDSETKAIGHIDDLVERGDFKEDELDYIELFLNATGEIRGPS